jgi:nucleotide-binding universal stress UspA family protein
MGGIMIDLRHILVPIDFSKHSEVALSYAVALAEKFGAELLLLHVVQDLALFIPDAVAVAPPIAPPVEQFITAAREALERVTQLNDLKSLTVHREVREGTPFYEIIRFAKEKTVDLIVMGTHGHTGLTHVLLGSVTEKVVRKAPCPVLTVRHPEHEFVHP